MANGGWIVFFFFIGGGGGWLKLHIEAHKIVSAISLCVQYFPC